MPGLISPEKSRRTTMGVADYSFHHTDRSKSTLDFLEYCHSLGAAGSQTTLSSLDPDYIRRIRKSLEASGMYFEVSLSLPRKEDGSEFERHVRAAKDAGAICLRSHCLGERRYEYFSTLDAWKNFVAESKAGLRVALPTLEKERMPMGIENHKDWTVGELVALLKAYDNEYLGACLDTGNNIALLDDPMEVVERLAPYAVPTHLKDMAVAEYVGGFLLAEVPLGEGFLDMKRIIAAIRNARPQTKLTLEMITRDALKVPCLSAKYWATFPDRNGSYLARTLTMVRSHKPPHPLPKIENLDRDSVMRLEEENVRRCLAYARDQLGLQSP
jgi:3-oxoisoapionate decarboxylase